MVDSTNLPEVDINQIATDLNGKMDKDGVNASCPTLLSRTANSNGGVTEIWSDGYCVQNGYANGSGVTVSLDTSYKDDSSYRIFLGGGNSTGWGNAPHSFTYYSVTASSFQIRMEENSTLASGMNCSWETKGYIR